VRLHSLRTVQWRNIEDGVFEFADGVNVLVGPNGQGKTNFLEAVQYLALGRSHRGARDDEIVRFGSDHFFVRGDAEGDAGEDFWIEAGFTPPRTKRLKVDGQPVARLTDLTGVLPCVSFGPEDAEIARGAPEHRRRYIDYTLAEASRSGLQALADYRRVAMQRATLLRSDAPEGDADAALAVWDEELVRFGVDVILRRADALVDLAPQAERLYALLTGGLRLHLRYRVQAIGQTVDPAGGAEHGLGDDRRAEIETAFREHLRSRKVAERIRRMNLVGPHRDDIELEVDGNDLRRFGSQGQCRAAAVALKMAQAEFITARRNDRPIVVLDDVFAELDEERARALWEIDCQRYQTFLAVPREADLVFGRGDTLFRVAAGSVVRES
jgi:DNA replication and repair protein RecF